MLGIDAARAAIMKELREAFQFGGSKVNYRHCRFQKPLRKEIRPQVAPPLHHHVGLPIRALCGPLRKVKEVQFGILSPEEIVSVLRLNSFFHD